METVCVGGSDGDGYSDGILATQIWREHTYADEDIDDFKDEEDNERFRMMLKTMGAYFIFYILVEQNRSKTQPLLVWEYLSIFPTTNQPDFDVVMALVFVLLLVGSYVYVSCVY